MLQEDFIIIQIYLTITETIKKKDYKHSQGKLYLSEIILCGVLFALRGKSFRQFYSWLCRKNLLNLPERTRLMRLIITHRDKSNKFLKNPTLLNVIDSFGVEVIHPAREGRSAQSRKVSSKGKSNYRWIVGRKINIAINGKLEIIDFQDAAANTHDNFFTGFFKNLKGIILSDKGYKKREDMPDNFKVCERGKWNERMVVETLFSLWARICNMKHSFHRTVKGFQVKSSYLVALTNILFKLNDKLGFNKLSMVQWAL